MENEFEVAVSRADVLRTQVTLASLQARQERIRAGLNRSGLTDIADRLDWLHAQKSPDEVLAWRRKWRDLRLVEDVSHIEFTRPVSLSVPKRRKKSKPVIAEARQLEIAMRVLAAKEAREGERKEAA